MDGQGNNHGITESLGLEKPFKVIKPKRSSNSALPPPNPGPQQPHPGGCGHVRRFSVDAYPTWSLHFSLFPPLLTSGVKYFHPSRLWPPRAAWDPGTSQTSSGFEASGTKNPQLLLNLGGKKTGNNLMANKLNHRGAPGIWDQSKRQRRKPSARGLFVPPSRSAGGRQGFGVGEAAESWARDAQAGPGAEPARSRT